jgi:hypothetical protein
MTRRPVPVAQKVEVVLTCDLDDRDTPAAETVVFSYDGQTYEFELCTAHLEEFHRVMQAYIQAARPTAARRRPAPTRGSASRHTAGSSELAVMREWARTHGFEVSDRGRIPTSVRQAFDAAQR